MGHASADICDKTTCEYGALFHDSDEFVTFDVATAERGNNWQTTEDFELSMLVKHDETDSNGSIFHCGHVRDTTDTCKCYCSNAGDHHIWHHAKRHAHSIQMGHTAALCQCQKNWVHNGKIFNGCQSPTAAGEPARYGATHPHSWCKIVPGSCNGGARAVTAGSDWDSCDTHTTFKL